MINEIPEEMMPEMFVVPITVPPTTYAKVVIQGNNITLEPRIKTNADRIRAMTDEELVFFFWGTVDGSGKTVEQWREWLKQEVKG